MLAGEGLAGAAHAAHDFVGDEQDAVLAADFGDARGVPLDRGNSPERGADDGFEDERGDGGGIVGLQKNVEVIGAGKIAFWIRFAEWAVVAETRSDVAPLWNHGGVGCAARRHCR